MARLTRGEARQQRHRRVRKKVFGTPERPRLCVYKSLRHIYAQLIDDTTGRTIVSVSTRDPSFNGTGGCNIESAKRVGKLRIIVRGPDKQSVGQVAAKIRGFRPLEPYKGTGIRYKDEQIIRKEGKLGGGVD